MEYTIKKLSQLAKVSVRTLQYYDEIGLLKPAYRAAQNARMYGEDELLQLQQILFLRELGIELKRIMQVMSRGDFDRLSALVSHREVLEERMKKDLLLIQTIDKTINHLRGEIKMKDHELYWGFDLKKQKEYEDALVKRFGETAQMNIDESYNRTKDWTNADHRCAEKESEALSIAFVASMEEGLSFDCDRVQALVASHHKWIEKFWSPTKDSYIQLGELYLDPDFREYYAKFHPDLAEFLVNGMRFYAQNKL